MWVPPIRKEDIALLTPGKHPFWETARRELFLALRGNKPVGRIAAIVDDKSNRYWQEKCGAFGFFECLPDNEAAIELLGSAANWLHSQGMTFMRGPLNPSTNYTCGLLVDGFDVPPGLMMPWNPPYYAQMFHRFCMRKEQDLLAYHIYKDRVKVASWLETELARLKEKGDFTFRRSKRSTLAQDVEIMLQIYGESWAKNFAFSPLSEAESKALVKELVSYGEKDTPQLRQDVKNKLVLREVLVQEAEKQTIASTDEVKKQLEFARRSILIDALRSNYLKKNPVSDKEVKAEYDRVASQQNGKQYQGQRFQVEPEYGYEHYRQFEPFATAHHAHPPEPVGHVGC